MTPELHERWQRGEAPFNGVTLTPNEWLPVPALAAALAELIPFLQAQSGSQLDMLLDWHAHDGFLTPAEPTTWEALAALVRMPGALVRAFTGGDTAVYRAYFPADCRFYLRIYLSDEDGPTPGEWSGTFDLSGPAILIDAARETLAQNGGGAWHTAPAHAYFNRTYAG